MLDPRRPSRSSACGETRMSEPRQTLFRSPSGDAEVILGDGPSVLAADLITLEPTP